jgi:tetratricopeptide (TPR) repeat protein
MSLPGFAERKRSLLVCGVSTAIFLCMAALPAKAAESDKVVARAHYETGTRLYDVREYADALKEYKAAYIAKPDPAFLFNIGQCYRKMGKNAEATDFFQQFLKKAPPDDPNRTLVEARIRNIEAGVSAEYDPFDHTGDVQAQPPVVKTELNPASTPVPPLQATLESNPPAGPVTPSEPVPPAAAKASSPADQPAAQQPLATPQHALQPAGLDLTAAVPAKEDAASSPIYEKWWFWTGVGAVVVAGVVTAIVLSSSGGGTTNPSSTLGARTIFP